VTVRVISERAREMLAMLPPYEDEDENVISAIQAAAMEIERLDDAGEAFMHKIIPINADEEFKTLSMWEALLNLTVAPAGVSVEERRNYMLSRLRSRSVSRGSEWIDRLSDVLGSGWSHQEGPTPYTVSLRVPYSAGGQRIDVSGFARLITPAHLDILFGYEEGFLVGISLIGDEI
jgi:hypothetical protein